MKNRGNKKKEDLIVLKHLNGPHRKVSNLLANKDLIGHVQN